MQSQHDNGQHSCFLPYHEIFVYDKLYYFKLDFPFQWCIIAYLSSYGFYITQFVLYALVTADASLKNA